MRQLCCDKSGRTCLGHSINVKVKCLAAAIENKATAATAASTMAKEMDGFKNQFLDLRFASKHSAGIVHWFSLDRAVLQHFFPCEQRCNSSALLCCSSQLCNMHFWTHFCLEILKKPWCFKACPYNFCSLCWLIGPLCCSLTFRHPLWECQWPTPKVI